MKIKKIPIVSLAGLIVVLIRLIAKHFFPAKFFYISAYLDGALLGVLLVFLMYYANIFITAWRRNRKEGLNNL